jgi:hypothetical protein
VQVHAGDLMTFLWNAGSGLWTPVLIAVRPQIALGQDTLAAAATEVCDRRLVRSASTIALPATELQPRGGGRIGWWPETRPGIVHARQAATLKTDRASIPRFATARPTSGNAAELVDSAHVRMIRARIADTLETRRRPLVTLQLGGLLSVQRYPATRGCARVHCFLAPDVDPNFPLNLRSIPAPDFPGRILGLDQPARIGPAGARDDVSSGRTAH